MANNLDSGAGSQLLRCAALISELTGDEENLGLAKELLMAAYTSYEKGDTPGLSDHLLLAIEALIQALRTATAE